MIKEFVWFKGGLVRRESAVVSVFSPTAQFGLNVFEGLRAYWNEEVQELFVVELDLHINRLFESAKIVGFKIPLSVNKIKAAIFDTLKKNDIREDVYIRLNAFVDGEGETSWFHSSPVQMYVFLTARHRKVSEELTGASINVVSWERISARSMPPRCKLGANYINSRYGQLEANSKGYDLPVFLNAEGNVSESAGSCIFLVREERLVTPTTSCSILDSITRRLIIEIARENALEVDERIVQKSELYSADEVFLCGTTAELIPVTSVDGFCVGDGQVGPITRRLFEAYIALATNISSSITPVYAIFQKDGV